MIISFPREENEEEIISTTTSIWSFIELKNYERSTIAIDLSATCVSRIVYFIDKRHDRFLRICYKYQRVVKTPFKLKNKNKINVFEKNEGK